MSRTFQTQTALEALVVEQALLLARELEKTANDAPDGKVLAQVEAYVLPAARELARKAFEAALQAQAKPAEKKFCHPYLCRLRQSRLAQATRRPQRPDCGRGRPPQSTLPRLPTVQERPTSARRPPGCHRVR